MTARVCLHCRKTVEDGETVCHPDHTILVESSSIELNSQGYVIDCAQAARQPFLAAKAVL